MMEQSLELINNFLQGLFVHGPFWIYLALITAAFIENVFPPFPGDFFTIAGGALAAAGWLNIFLVFGCVYVGGISSTAVVYYFGYSFGRDFFMRKDYKLFSAGDIMRLDQWFRNKGATLLVFSRFIVGARTAIALVTGISKYNFTRAFFFTSISFWIFNGLLLFSSYIFVVNFHVIAYYLRMYEKVVWPVVILIVVAFIIVKVYRTKKNEK